MKEIIYRPNNNEKYFKWIGKKANANFDTLASIKGSVFNKKIESLYLGESRELTIYNPPKISSNTPIIYLTDGDIVNDYAKYVDALIDKNVITPIILVGAHASNVKRYEEYIKGANEIIFQKHLNFFLEEVMTSYEKSILGWDGKRYMYGFSNGAAFCVYLGLEKPELFQDIIAYSTADYIREFIAPITLNYDNYPNFVMGAGRYEESIFMDNSKFVSKLKNNNIEVDFKEFVSGHDSFTWEIEFLNYVVEEFKK
ncbi:MAG: hypothetical protein HC892_21085 [Saprospiraceae bacterium]|nr:hypothetical protein [Saprospiraceae bacterium]